MRSVSETTTSKVVSRGAAPSTGSDRRRHTRYPVVLGCKVRRGRVLRFAPGATVDVSRGGALIRVQDASSYVPGESLEMGVVWDGSAVVASAWAAGVAGVAIAATDTTRRAA